MFFSYKIAPVLTSITIAFGVSISIPAGHLSSPSALTLHEFILNAETLNPKIVAASIIFLKKTLFFPLLTIILPPLCQKTFSLVLICRTLFKLHAYFHTLIIQIIFLKNNKKIFFFFIYSKYITIY